MIGALKKTRTSTAGGNMHLKHARLPIPPPGQLSKIDILTFTERVNIFFHAVYIHLKKQRLYIINIIGIKQQNNPQSYSV